MSSSAADSVAYHGPPRSVSLQRVCTWMVNVSRSSHNARTSNTVQPNKFKELLREWVLDSEFTLSPEQFFLQLGQLCQLALDLFRMCGMLQIILDVFSARSKTNQYIPAIVNAYGADKLRRYTNSTDFNHHNVANWLNTNQSRALLISAFMPLDTTGQLWHEIYKRYSEQFRGLKLGVPLCIGAMLELNRVKLNPAVAGHARLRDTRVKQWRQILSTVDVRAPDDLDDMTKLTAQQIEMLDSELCTRQLSRDECKKWLCSDDAYDSELFGLMEYRDLNFISVKAAVLAPALIQVIKVLAEQFADRDDGTPDITSLIVAYMPADADWEQQPTAGAFKARVRTAAAQFHNAHHINVVEPRKAQQREEKAARLAAKQQRKAERAAHRERRSLKKKQKCEQASAAMQIDSD